MDFEGTWTYKRRVARELDFFRTRESLSYEELARKIMQETALSPYNRADYKPLSARSLKELVRGTRNSQKRVVQAASSFLTVANDFPVKFGRSLVFDLDPDVVELAIRQARFFQVRDLPKNFVASFEGRYSVIRPQSLMSYDLIVDYVDDLGILLVRGNMRYKDDPEDEGVKLRFLSGYAIASTDTLSVFLTDHEQPFAYIFQLPLNGGFDPKYENPIIRRNVKFLGGMTRGEAEIPFHESLEWPYSYLEDNCIVHSFPYYPRPNDREHFAHDESITECFRDVFGDNEFLATEQLRLVLGARAYPGKFKMLTSVKEGTKYLECRNYATFAETVIRLFSYSGASVPEQPITNNFC